MSQSVSDAEQIEHRFQVDKFGCCAFVQVRKPIQGLFACGYEATTGSIKLLTVSVGIIAPCFFGLTHCSIQAFLGSRELSRQRLTVSLELSAVTAMGS